MVRTLTRGIGARTATYKASIYMVRTLTRGIGARTATYKASIYG